MTLDQKGIAVYLFVAFLLAVLVAGGGSALGWYGQGAAGGAGLAAALAAAWIPAVAAFAARRASRMSGANETKAWPLPPMGALAAALLPPVVFTMIFLVLSLLGMAAPDWEVGQLMAFMPEAGTGGAADIPPSFLLAMGFLVMLTLLPVLYAMALLGHEWGWRGFLLPKLLPMGRFKAYVAAGALWAGWLAILAIPYMGAPGARAGLFLRLLLVVWCFSIVLNEMWRRMRNHGVTALALGAFCANLLGVWPHLFPYDNPPWGGTLGIVSIAVWGVLAAMALAAGARQKDQTAFPAPTE